MAGSKAICCDTSFAFRPAKEAACWVRRRTVPLSLKSLYSKMVKIMMSMTSSIRCDLGSMFASSKTTRGVLDVSKRYGQLVLMDFDISLSAIPRQCERWINLIVLTEREVQVLINSQRLARGCAYQGLRQVAVDSGAFLILLLDEKEMVEL